MRRIASLGSWALLLAGCTDPPLSPDEERASLAAQRSLTPPSNLTASAPSSNQIRLAWRDNSTGESGFEVHRSTDGTNGPYAELAVTGTDVQSYTDGSVNPSTAYCYEVRAFRTTGNKKSYSPFSGSVCASTLTSPSGLKAIAEGPSIILTWTDNSGNEEGFRVQRSPNGSDPWTLLFIRSANATIAEDIEPPEQQLCYRLTAFNAEGESNPSNVDCATILFPPSNLSATRVDDATIELRWTNSSTLADAVEVYRYSATTPLLLIATLERTASVYRDAGLSPNSTFWYKVRAKRQDDGVSSDIVIGSTGSAPPEAPSGLLAYPNSSTSLSVWWQNNSQNASGQRIEQSDDGGTSWRTIETFINGGGYWFHQSAVTDHLACYRVISFNGAGDSPPSNVACTAPPAAATDLSATRIDEMTVEITWRDNSSVEDGYDILTTTDGFLDNMEVIGHVAANITTFRADNAPRFAYPYRVQPTRDGGVGSWSEYVDVGDWWQLSK